MGQGVVGVVVFGVAFGLGSFRTFSPTEEAPEDAKAITFQGQPGQGGSSAKAGSEDHFNGKIEFTAFAGAGPRLEELLAAMKRLTDRQRYFSPVDSERLLDEIEQILALAGEEEMVAFIEAAEWGDNDSALAEIAYAALAKISPSRAAGVGLGQWENRPMNTYPGLMALMREWEKRDLSGAERWIEGLDNEALKKLSTVALFTMRAATDPTRVLTDLAEIDSKKGWGIASVLGESLALEKMAETADLFLGKGDGGTPRGEMLGVFLGAWGKREPEAMMAWLFSQDLESLGAEAVGNSLRGLAIEDPAALLDRIAPEVKTQPILGAAAAETWRVWLGLEGEEAAAIEWVGDHLDVAEGLNFFQNFYMNTDEWYPDRVQRVLDALISLSDSNSKNTLSQGLLPMFSRNNPRAVVDYALEYLPLGSKTDYIIANAVSSWAQSGNPEEAIQWALDNVDSENARNSAVRSSMNSWAKRDGAEVAVFALGLPEKLRDGALDGIASGWAQRDPEGVISFLRDLPDPDAASNLTRNSFRYIAENVSGSQYFSQALEMPPGKMRHDAMRGLFGGWALSDAEAGASAIEKVPNGDLRDAAILGYNSFAARNDPKRSWNLATQLSVEATRDKELIFRGRSWIKKDSAAATAAIRATEGLSESVKAEIFK
jgi:hypothetical protein